MATSPSFGVLVLPNTEWPEILQKACHSEEMGLDLLVMADHFVDWSEPTRLWHEGWAVLTAIAMATSKIRIATYVTQIPLRHPAMLARQALTVDHISNGRLDIGLGTGIDFDPSHNMMGLAKWEPKERVARFKEYTRIVDRLLTNEVSSFDGEYYTINDAMVKPRPVQLPRPPIVIGALGPVMLRFAAEIADVWNTLSFADSFEKQLVDIRGKVAVLDEACAKIGRGPASLRRSYLMLDPEARKSGGGFSYYESTGAFEDMAGRIMEAGFSELCLYYPVLKEQISMFERIAQDVLPKLRC